MKNLNQYIIESLLDDEEDLVNDDTDLIEDFISKNFRNTIKYKIHDNIVDVDGNIYMEKSDAKSLTGGLFKFGKIKGGLTIWGCPNIKNLEGCPSIIGKFLTISDCDNLINFEGGPKNVKGAFTCRNCRNLESLKGAPDKVGFDFTVVETPKLKTIEYLPKTIKGYIYMNMENFSLQDQDKIKEINAKHFTIKNAKYI